MTSRPLAPFVFATGNPDKAREALEILCDAVAWPLAAQPLTFDETVYGYVIAEVEALAEVAATGCATLTVAPEVEETGLTLAANAQIKALGLHDGTGLTCVADDTGLIVDALDGRPGVHSARYAGPNATYADNVARLLNEMDGASSRAARFVTAIHVVHRDGREHHIVGSVEGTIASYPSGDGTFGYDPVFVPAEGDGRTFAQMAPVDKHALSHRGRALRKLCEYLLNEVE